MGFFDRLFKRKGKKPTKKSEKPRPKKKSHSETDVENYTIDEAVTRTSYTLGPTSTKDIKTEFNIADVLFNRYEIIDIKKGGMGLVYIAVDTKTNHLIAIKTFQKKFMQRESVVEGFLHEAGIWVSLGKHTNIVWAHKIDRIDGKPYIFLEYIDGGSLNDRISGSNIPLKISLDICIQFCTGMIYAYEKANIIHRDIKPENILMTGDGVVKITDFGISRSLEETEASGFFTPPYASPEQIREAERPGKSKLTPATDIYSFGIVMYRLFSKGKMPFDAKTPDEWMQCHMNKIPTGLRDQNPELPAEHCDTVMRCLEKDPNERYKDFSNLRDDLIAVYSKRTGKQYIVRGKKEKTEDSYLDGSRVMIGLSAAQYGKFDAAIQYYEKALNGCLERGDKQGQSACYNNMGIVALDKSDYDRALKYFNNALQINVALGDKQVQSRCYTNMGIVSQRKGDYDQALEYYNKSLKIGQRLGDKEVQSSCYMNMGLIAQRKGDYDQALVYHKKSLQINLASGDKQGQSSCYMNMGVINKMKGDYKQALEYYHRSLQIDIALGHKQGQCKCYGDMGNVAAAIGDYDQALEYYNQSLEIALALGDKQVQSMLYTNLGAVSVSKDDYNQALGYFDKSLQMKMMLEDISGQSICYNNMGIIARKRGDYDRALEYYNNSLKIALTLGDKPLQSACYLNMGNVAVDKGDYHRALEYLNKALELNKILGLDTSELEKYIREVKNIL